MPSSAWKMQLALDMTDFSDALHDLARWLKAGNVLERIDTGLLDEFRKCISHGHIEELYELVPVSAVRANEFRVYVKPRGLLERAMAALWALRAEIKVCDAHFFTP